MHIRVGGFGSGGCFNPAVALGTFMNGLNTGTNMAPIIIADLLGGAAAALAFKALYNSQGADD